MKHVNAASGVLARLTRHACGAKGSDLAGESEGVLHLHGRKDGDHSAPFPSGGAVSWKNAYSINTTKKLFTVRKVKCFQIFLVNARAKITEEECV